MKLKKIILSLILISVLSLIYSDDNELAKYYINQAINFINTNSNSTANEYLDKAIEYSKVYPEYYYLKNKLLSDNKENIAYKKDNSDLIIKYLNNSFAIDQFDLLKHTAFIYEKTRNFDKCYNSYKLILSNVKKTDKEYLNCIKMLFNSTNQTHFELIPAVINNAKTFFDSPELDFYLIKYKITANKIEINEFLNAVNNFNANKFSPSKILYLQILFFKDVKIISALLNDYNKLKASAFESGYKKKIVFEFLKKAGYINDNQLRILLTDWSQIGQNDYKTSFLFQNIRLLNIIRSNKNFNEIYLNYTGARRNDLDEDGEWENFYEYSKGIIIHSITDVNQDGIYENEAFFNEKGIMKEYVIYYNIKNYNKMIFNIYDNSLIYLEYYNNNKLIEKITLLQSAFKPDKNNLGQINKKSIMQYIAFSEEWKDGYKMTNYANSIKEYIFVDNNKNNIYEEKILYKDNQIDEIYKDKNENGKFEVYEKYDNSKLVMLKYITDESLLNYNYIEKYFSDKTVKQWDNNNDGLFETEIEEFNNNIKIKKTDINFDQKYDFAYYYKNDNLYKIISLSDNKEIKFSDKNVKEDYNDYQKNQKWNIISSRDLKTLVLPDDIIVNDKNNLSGIYYYNKEKFYFSNGIIKNAVFNYNIYYINEVLYLYDNY